MSLLCLILYFILIINFEIIFSATHLKWIEELGNSWSISCDFPENDLASVAIEPELEIVKSCLKSCRLTLGCTHYFWSKNVCFLKQNRTITKKDAIFNNNLTTFCGILTPGIKFFYFKSA